MNFATTVATLALAACVAAQPRLRTNAVPHAADQVRLAASDEPIPSSSPEDCAPPFPECDVLPDCTGCVIPDCFGTGLYQCVTQADVQEMFDRDNMGHQDVTAYMDAECPNHNGSLCGVLEGGSDPAVEAE